MWNLTLQPRKTSYLLYHNSYGYQPWQGGDLSWGASTHKITWSLDYLVFWGHAKNHSIFITTVLVTSKIGRMVTHLVSYPKSYLTLWSRSFARSLYKLKPFYLNYLSVKATKVYLVSCRKNSNIKICLYLA